MAHHTKRCLAKSIMCAVENVRDEQGMTDANFAAADFGAIGQGYLDDGTATCECHVAAIPFVQHVYEESGAEVATKVAADELRFGHITPGQYMDLVKWAEGRGPLAESGSTLCFRCRQAFRTVAERLEHEASGTCPLT